MDTSTQSAKMPSERLIKLCKLQQRGEQDGSLKGTNFLLAANKTKRSDNGQLRRRGETVLCKCDATRVKMWSTFSKNSTRSTSSRGGLADHIT